LTFAQVLGYCYYGCTYIYWDVYYSSLAWVLRVARMAVGYSSQAYRWYAVQSMPCSRRQSARFTEKR
jgi:hypothetical protein